MIDHVNLPVADLERAKAFYTRALRPFGISPLFADAAAVGFGRHSWILGIVATTGPITPLHVALAADTPAMVDAFHAEAVAAGARDNGRPGPRADYGSDYYAAYVIDDDGHNVEAVFRGVGG